MNRVYDAFMLGVTLSCGLLGMAVPFVLLVALLNWVVKP